MTELDRLRDAVVQAARRLANIPGIELQAEGSEEAFSALDDALAALDAHPAQRATAETVRVAKMVQIAVCQSDNDGSGCLYALMDDGRLFSRRPASDAPWQEQSTPTSLATLPLDPETDEIVERALAALRAELAAVREALDTFVETMDMWAGDNSDRAHDGIWRAIKTARAALGDTA